MADEPTLPKLPKLTWDEETQSFSNNPRKRLRARSQSGKVSTPISTSSDPAIFSSDDDPSLENYSRSRRKKRYVGSWYQQHPTSSDSAIGEESRRILPKGKRTFQRNFDSGVWMSSDGTDGSDDTEELYMPKSSIEQHSVHQLAIKSSDVSEAEQRAQQIIRRCLDHSVEDINLE
jgi:hypothetical protein